MNETKNEWPKSNCQLAILLGVKEHALRALKRRHSKELIEGKDEDYTYKNFGIANAPVLMTAWHKRGAVKLAHYCRSAKAREFLENEGIQKLHVNYVESEIIDIIIDAVEGFTSYSKQYSVAGYRVDLYLKELNLAIECDEMGHENHNNSLEILRQKTIEEKLGCTFLRFNPDDKFFKIGKILNQIINYILIAKSARRLG